MALSWMQSLILTFIIDAAMLRLVFYFCKTTMIQMKGIIYHFTDIFGFF